ncbi:hypothetical protein ASPCADRAFT_130826 [Aspergillus carbonarius ITEM 5010]|uniref:DUF7730 domain-containing protein n=1 Tax=Aspergillus carbonarius (strain ITEM 5010) TaxID=602072 RepID=A0A1R3RLH6_ASPC5|nr:hypothetical protein ASPCADRAFT_130826 [Aspergillus carbonarius ITEM 5010]
MAMASTRTDTVNTFFNLETRNPEPICREPSNHHSIPTNPPSSSPPRKSLLSLPPELRIQIYELLLINRFTRDDPPHHHHIHNTKPINLALLPTTITITTPPSSPSPSLKSQSQSQSPSPSQTLTPSILLLNKQISTESLPILYTLNTFALTAPHHLTTFLSLIGPQNTHLLRSLDIFVPWRRNEIWPWVVLLNFLSTQAPGLRYMRVGWDADCEHPGRLKPGAEERGLGDNLLFVHALGRIRQLESDYGFISIDVLRLILVLTLIDTLCLNYLLVLELLYI